MVSLHIETARFKSPGHKNELYLLKNTLITTATIIIIIILFTSNTYLDQPPHSGQGLHLHTQFQAEKYIDLIADKQR